MAKIFYVVEKAPDYAQVNFFKTEKEALEYGISELPQFDMFDEPMNDEEADGEEWYKGDSLTFKKGILFSFEGGEVYVQAMDEDAAREYIEELGEEGGAAIFFDGFSRGMYGYLGTAADGKGFKWDWDGYDINESTSTGGLKHARLFEQFIKESMLNEKKADGTISDDEDERRAELLKRVKEQMQELLASAEFDANDIGGSFRAPGIMHDIRKELDSQIKKFK